MFRAERIAGILILGLLAPAAAQVKICPADTSGLHRRIVSCRAERSMAECRKAVEAISCSVDRELELINAVVITVPDNEAKSVSVQFAARPEFLDSEDDEYVKWISGGDLMLPKFDFPSMSMKQLIPKFVRSQQQHPIDPASPKPPQSQANGQLPWGIARVNAPAAWGANMGAGVKVAIIDTGIDYNHPALRDNVKGGVNMVNQHGMLWWVFHKKPSKAEDYMDDQGHGSHVAGTIAAAFGEGAGVDKSGVVGVAPRASLYGVKVLDAQGGGNYSDIIAGIEWAVKNHMQVANMSLGAPKGSKALQRAVAAAKKAGLVIMAAAGNDSGGAVSYPAAYPETIAVSASNDQDAFAYFSSQGPEVNFIAPGQDILSVKLGGGYIVHSGTSMATPHMAGLAALAIANGAKGFDGVKQALSRAATQLPGLTADQQGRGLIDAGKLAPRVLAAASY